MALTEGESSAVRALLAQLELDTNAMLSARDDAYALLRIHQDIDHTTCITVLNNAKIRAKTSAQALVTLLS